MSCRCGYTHTGRRVSTHPDCFEHGGGRPGQGVCEPVAAPAPERVPAEIENWIARNRHSAVWQMIPLALRNLLAQHASPRKRLPDEVLADVRRATDPDELERLAAELRECES